MSPGSSCAAGVNLYYEIFVGLNLYLMHSHMHADCFAADVEINRV